MKPSGLLYCLRFLWTWRCAAISFPTFLSFWSYIYWPKSNWFIPTQFFNKKQRIAQDDHLVLGPCRSRLAKTKGFLLRSSSTYGRENVEWKRNKPISISCSSARKKSLHVLIVPFPALSRTQLKHQRLLQLLHDTRASLYLVNLVFI